MISIYKKLTSIISNDAKCIVAFLLFIFCIFLPVATFAENIDINFEYGINNIAKSGNELPVELTIDNKGSQKFSGRLDLNVYETNDTLYTYRAPLSIDEHSQVVKKFNISLANNLNTVSIDVLNDNDEIVYNIRNNIDLSYYNNKLIIGVISPNYTELTYLDNLLLTDTGIETKLVEINTANNNINDRTLNLVDMLIVSDYNLNLLGDNEIYSIEKFVESGKPIIINEEINEYGISNLPHFLNELYANAKIVEMSPEGLYYRIIDTNKMIIFIIPFSLGYREYSYENTNFFIDLLSTNAVTSYITKITNNENFFVTNDYYNISNLLNVVDRMILPNISRVSFFIVIYIFVLLIVLYGLLRNANRRKMYGRFVFVIALLASIFVFYVKFSTISKNVNLTYISIVDIKDANTSEKAFLSFRTNESGDFSFKTDSSKSLYPILKGNREPIRSINFLDDKSIKQTVFENVNDTLEVRVNNAKSFDNNLYIYENNNYLNDVYNINCSFERFDGEVTGRITNNMRVAIHDAKLLLFGKVLDIGDIAPNYSLSLSRARTINTPINNNEMLADILSSPINRDILKYYLDENINGYFNYALLFGFIDNNGTIDISSDSVGNIYGRTLIVTKINDNKMAGISDLCSLQNLVENVDGYYNESNNSIRGDEAVTNNYKFDSNADISKIYFEGIDSYDSGNIDSNVPFYGDIYAYNLTTLEYDQINENRVLYDSFNTYLTSDNQITLRFVPTSRDPLYRMISLPIVRAIAAN